MKVVLLRDVAKLGRKHSIVEVPDGFALNNLIPKKDALPATPANVKRVLSLQSVQAQSKSDEVSRATEMSAMTQKQPLHIIMESNDKGHLFQAVQAREVVSALQALGHVCDSAHIVFDQPIKDCGQHTAYIKAQGKTFPLMLMITKK